MQQRALHYSQSKIKLPSSSTIDNNWAMMIVWRIWGKIIRTVLCCIVYNQMHAQTNGNHLMTYCLNHIISLWLTCLRCCQIQTAISLCFTSLFLARGLNSLSAFWFAMCVSKVVGIDCEWVSSDQTQLDGLPGRRPVSLLQLASASGICVLVRLHLLTYIPDSLKQLLADRRCHEWLSLI